MGEGASSITGSITLDPADGSFGKVVDGKLYVQLDAAGTTDAMEGGSLTVDGTPVSTQSVSGIPGVPDGTYYVIDVGEDGDTLNLEYTMPNGTTTVPGTVAFTAYAQVQEDNAAAKTVSQTGAVTVQVVNNGVTVTPSTATGPESATNAAKAIELTGTNGLAVSLNDNDGSESFGTILLSNLPDGFLVMVGSDAASAQLASNAGGDGTTNTWVLSSSGGLPDYVAIVPPAHWSGTLSGLQLNVMSGESSLAPRTDTVSLGTLTVTPVADGVSLSPTLSFGTEGEIIPLNLNATMADPIAAVAGQADANTETTTLKLTGLGEHAAFYLGTELLTSADGHTVTYDAATDAYTLTGLTQDELDDLGFVQAKDALANSSQISVEAWTVDGSSTSTSTSATLPLSITAQQATSGDDSLLYTGSSLDGGAGSDTVSLRYLENVTGNDLANNLHNIETIDLSVPGANSITGGLSLQDVLDMTGSSNTLTIDGDSSDAVELKNGDWTEVTDDGNADYATYTGSLGGNTITLLIEDELHNNVNFVS